MFYTCKEEEREGGWEKGGRKRKGKGGKGRVKGREGKEKNERKGKRKGGRERRKT